MEPLHPGLRVFDINDRRFGDVQTTRSCCFEVAMGKHRVALVPDSVFTVTGVDVTLVCESARAATYSCLIHSPKVAIAQEGPVATLEISRPFR